MKIILSLQNNLQNYALGNFNYHLDRVLGNTYRNHRVLFWLPRILSLFFTTLMFWMTIQSFLEERIGERQIETFVFDLIPSIFLMGAVFLAWKQERLGGIIFSLLALFAFFSVNLSSPRIVLFLLPLLIGGLFLEYARLVYKRKKQVHRLRYLKRQSLPSVIVSK